MDDLPFDAYSESSVGLFVLVTPFVLPVYDVTRYLEPVSRFQECFREEDYVDVLLAEEEFQKG